MAIFPSLKVEKIVQTNDKTRLSAIKSFISKEEAAITLVEIEPEAASGFIDVTGAAPIDSENFFLDWRYSGTSRTVTVTVRITTDGAPVVFTDTISILIPADDALFSIDKDLTSIEEEVLRFVADGRNSFLNQHRKAQTIILSELDERGVINSDGSRILKTQIVEVEDVREWSTYITLWLIYQDQSDAVDDVFDQKAKMFFSRSEFHKDRAFIRIDFNKDGEVDTNEFQNVRSVRMVKR